MRRLQLYPLVQLVIAIAVVITFVGFIPLDFEINYKKIQKDDILVIKFLVQNWVLFELKITELYSSLGKLNSRFLLFKMYLSDSLTSSPEQEIEVKKPLKYFNELSRYISKISKIVRANFTPLKHMTQQLYKTITCQKIAWSTELGLDDAASTALITGLLWAVKNSIYRNIQRNVILNDKLPNLMVKPKFGNSYLKTDLVCIFRIRLGHIIVTGIKFIFLALSFLVEGGEKSD